VSDLVEALGFAAVDTGGLADGGRREGVDDDVVKPAPSTVWRWPKARSRQRESPIS